MKPGETAHYKMDGVLLTNCWCEAFAALISADMVAKGETWSCSPDCFARYAARCRRRRHASAVVSR